MSKENTGILSPPHCPCRKEALAHFISAETQELHRAVIAYRADVEAHRMRFTATAPYAVTAELTLACVSDKRQGALDRSSASISLPS